MFEVTLTYPGYPTPYKFTFDTRREATQFIAERNKQAVAPRAILLQQIER